MSLKRIRIGFVPLVTFFLTGYVSASVDSIGPNGINSNGLTAGGMLTGAGIGIGQVELSRPGKRVADGGFDSPANANSSINPTDVFIRTTGGISIANMNISDHAEQVAGVMISTSTTDPDGAGPRTAPIGVVTAASLYSSATNPIGPDFDAEAAITLQHVATRNGGDVRAINMSFGNPPAGGSIFDGNQLLTQFVDWSASQHDTLYVIAGNEGTGGIPAPTENFNGMTIAASDKVGSVYRKVASLNSFSEDAEGERTSVDLIAPGINIDVAGLGGATTVVSGTSFAAPHVTGTVALLQEYGDNRISAGASGWDADARRHEVMKSVLMNSADKLKDDGSVLDPNTGQPFPVGTLLGMERTVVKQDGVSTWLDSFAYNDGIEGGGEP